MLNASHWDYKNNKVKSTHPNSARLNSFLTNKFNELQDQVFEYETAQKSLTTRQLKDKIFGKKPTDFFAFAEEVIIKKEKSGRMIKIDLSLKN